MTTRIALIAAGLITGVVVGYNLNSPTSPEIRRAIAVTTTEQEVRQAIPVEPEVRRAIPVHKEQPAVAYVPIIIAAAADDDDDDYDVETGMERYYENRMFAPQYEQGDQHPSSYQPVTSLYARERDSEPSNFAPYHPTG